MTIDIPVELQKEMLRNIISKIIREEKINSRTIDKKSEDDMARKITKIIDGEFNIYANKKNNTE